jgi:hypothetical protein
LSVLLRYPRAVKSLGLTDKQVANIADLIVESLRRTTLIPAELNAIPHPDADDLAQQTSAAYRKQTEKKLRDMLTEKQQSTVKELIGDPFKGRFASGRTRRNRWPADR